MGIPRCLPTKEGVQGVLPCRGLGVSPNYPFSSLFFPHIRREGSVMGVSTPPLPRRQQLNKKMHPCEVGCIFLLRGKTINRLIYSGQIAL